MRDYRLSEQELDELRAAHRAVREIREAYRINAVILLGQGRSVKGVADALLMDPDTVRTYFKRYKDGGVDELLRMSYIGSEALLDDEQLRALDEHLQSEVYQTAAEVARYVEKRWGVRYTPSGMTALLHRLGYVYKKPKLQPGKHPPVEVQEAFVAKYQDLKKNKAEGEVILFMDAAHPQHNPVLGCGWIKRGRTQSIQSNTGRQRLNINGAIKVVAKYLQSSRIQLEPLPAYSPNLNLIEHFWKFFKKQVLYNRYYGRFSEFQAACRKFFEELHLHAPRLRTLLTENFQIIGN